MDFKEFPKIPRLTRECVITEKIDGTNASIYIGEDGTFLVGSRTRWITPENDNYGFAKWALANKNELMRLGPGHHFGEWWGKGIQRGYAQEEKTFSLFAVHRWSGVETRPACCGVVPILYEGIFSEDAVKHTLMRLEHEGSVVSPGFMKPEGIIIYHTASKGYFKKTIEKDHEYKGKASE